MYAKKYVRVSKCYCAWIVYPNCTLGASLSGTFLQVVNQCLEFVQTAVMACINNKKERKEKKKKKGNKQTVSMHSSYSPLDYTWIHAPQWYASRAGRVEEGRYKGCGVRGEWARSSDRIIATRGQKILRPETEFLDSEKFHQQQTYNYTCTCQVRVNLCLCSCLLVSRFGLAVKALGW